MRASVLKLSLLITGTDTELEKHQYLIITFFLSNVKLP